MALFSALNLPRQQKKNTRLQSMATISATAPMNAVLKSLREDLILSCENIDGG